MLSMRLLGFAVAICWLQGIFWFPLFLGLFCGDSPPASPDGGRLFFGSGG